MALRTQATPDRSHRQILSVLDKHTDGQSDADLTTDDELHNAKVDDDEADSSSLVGFSIGRAQTEMRSPTTPAAIKAQALESSRDYFTTDPDTIEEDQTDDGAESTRTDNIRSESSSATASYVHSASKPQAQSRASMRRSTLGSSSVVGSLRKLLPELPSTNLFKLPAVPAPGQQVEAEQRSTQRKHSESPEQSHLGSESRPERQRSRNGMPGSWDGNSSSLAVNEPDERPRNLRRATSDQSLYLRPAVTGGSAFDDYAVFSQVAEMPNSRFKAITDSFQDSSLRMPKLPSIGFPMSRTTLDQSESGLASEDTMANASSEKDLPNISLRDEPVQTRPSTARNTGSKHPILKAALARFSGDLVIMGGYRGSILRSAEPPHQQVWVPVKVGLNLRKVDLEVGLNHQDEEEMEKTIIPSGILSHIGPIDISRRLLKKIQRAPSSKSGQLRLHDWGYDWRLSPGFLSRKLIKFLESLECNRPGVSPEQRGALVIAHSLGGLITRYAVNQRPELFSGVIYAGTPQRCCNILGPLRNGDDVLLSSRVLTAQVNFTLRTSYALLPEDGRCFLNKDTGERYDIDFFDAKTWDEYRLSPCINPALPIATPKKKGIVGSISETISSFTTSVTPKRSSWFGSNDSTNTSPKETIKEKAHDLETAAAQPLEPTMQSPLNATSPANQPSTRPPIATTSTIPLPAAKEYLARTLHETQTFKQSLLHNPAHQSRNLYPPHALIFGKSMPTVYGAKVASRDAIKHEDAYDDLAFAAGDGVVLASAAQLPSGYRCVRGGRVESDKGHVGLLGDLEGLGRCIHAVLDGRERGIGLGK